MDKFLVWLQLWALLFYYALNRQMSLAYFWQKPDIFCIAGYNMRLSKAVIGVKIV